MPSEKEWISINEIVKEIYTTTNLEDLGRTFMLLIRKHVPYQSAALTIVNDDFTVDLQNNVLIGTDLEMIEQYNRYASFDFTNEVLSFLHSAAYRDIDFIDEDKKAENELYKNVFKKNSQNYSGGLVIIKPGLDKRYCITFFRNGQKGSLSDKELFVLELFIGHLENLIEKFTKSEDDYPFDFTQTEEYAALSDREKELLPYILRGYSNVELGDHFNISVSTAKKHVYSIMRKFNASHRGELIQKVFPGTKMMG